MADLLSAKIKVGEKVFHYQAGLASNDFQLALAHAHRKGTTFCLCNSDAPVRLTVRRYEREEHEVVYGLAKWPDTGLDHSLECIFFGEDAAKSVAPDTKPSFEELPDGCQRVFLATSLALSSESTADIQTKLDVKSGPGSSRQRATEISLLTNLWRRARLNIYKGKSRYWFNVCFSLLAAAKKIVLNKGGSTLSEYLLIGGANDDRLVDDHNVTVLNGVREHPSRLFVIGRMRAKASDKSQFMLSFKDYKGLPRISISSRSYEDFVNNRVPLRSALEKNEGNVVVIACIEPSGTDWWKVVHLTGILTSKNYIPVESSFEMKFDDYLTSCSRTYLKPLAVDEDEESSNMRADFILLDTSPRTYCEVWGMSTSDYLANKALKENKYMKNGQSLISWNPLTQQALPSLPFPNFQKNVQP